MAERKKLRSQPAGGTSSQFEATLLREIPIWRKIVTKLGVKAE